MKNNPQKTPVICIGRHTIERLRRGEEVSVYGVTLVPADDLLKQPEISLVAKEPPCPTKQ